MKIINLNNNILYSDTSFLLRQCNKDLLVIVLGHDYSLTQLANILDEENAKHVLFVVPMNELAGPCFYIINTINPNYGIVLVDPKTNLIHEEIFVFAYNKIMMNQKSKDFYQDIIVNDFKIDLEHLKLITNVEKFVYDNL